MALGPEPGSGDAPAAARLRLVREKREKKRKRTGEIPVPEVPKPERLPTPTPTPPSLPSIPGQSMTPMTASPLASSFLQTSSKIEVSTRRDDEPVIVIPDESSPPVFDPAPVVVAPSAPASIPVSTPAPTPMVVSAPAPPFGRTYAPTSQPSSSRNLEAFASLLDPNFKASVFVQQYLSPNDVVDWARTHGAEATLDMVEASVLQATSLVEQVQPFIQGQNLLAQRVAELENDKNSLRGEGNALRAEMARLLEERDRALKSEAATQRAKEEVKANLREALQHNRALKDKVHDQGGDSRVQEEVAEV